jgi:hypothetical protein
MVVLFPSLLDLTGRSSGNKELFALDVMKSSELIFFKLPRINAFGNALGKCKLAPPD